jgi:lipopolysaccharide transport system ATP-binding protein
MQPIIRVTGLGKQYRIGRRESPYQTMRESLIRAGRGSLDRIRRVFDRRPDADSSTVEELFWALKDVDFGVQPCEVVGVIGRNGAGKSTLLKILSRVTEPTTGRVDLYGRVGSLLEVGTGFHPELTGRENIFLNGAILGMSRREIVRKLDEIIAFAEIDKFVDTPVKRYSSGMYMRLAFAVAAHLEPEILIIDEVLAVGDAQFQKKCLGKISEVASHGRTILFVSHNMVAIQALCTRCVWLNQGQLIHCGPTIDVVREYLKAGSSSITQRVWDKAESAPGNDRIRLQAVRLVLPPGVTDDTLTIKTPFDIEFEYRNLKENCRLNLSMFLHNEDNVCVFNTTSFKESRWDGIAFPKGVFRSKCEIPADLLNDGVYRVSVLFVEDTSIVINAQKDLLEFEVHDDQSDRGHWYGKWEGVTRPRLRWDTTCLQAAR